MTIFCFKGLLYGMMFSNAIFLLLQGCVKVWDIGQSSGKSPISTLECLVSS